MIRLAKHGNKTIRAMKDTTSSPRVDEGRTDSKKDGAPECHIVII